MSLRPTRKNSNGSTTTGASGNWMGKQSVITPHLSEDQLVLEPRKSDLSKPASQAKTGKPICNKKIGGLGGCRAFSSVRYNRNLQLGGSQIIGGKEQSSVQSTEKKTHNRFSTNNLDVLADSLIGKAECDKVAEKFMRDIQNSIKEKARSPAPVMVLRSEEEFWTPNNKKSDRRGILEKELVGIQQQLKTYNILKSKLNDNKQIIQCLENRLKHYENLGNTSKKVKYLRDSLEMEYKTFIKKNIDVETKIAELQAKYEEIIKLAEDSGNKAILPEKEEENALSISSIHGKEKTTKSARAILKRNNRVIQSMKKQIIENEKIQEAAVSHTESAMNDIIKCEILKEKIKEEMESFQSRISIISSKLEEMQEHGITANYNSTSKKRGSSLVQGAKYGACVIATAAISLCVKACFSKN